MARDAHHRAFAVAHQHVVAYPDRQGGAGQRMGHGQAGSHALLVDRGKVRFHDGAPLALVDELGEGGIAARGVGSQRMLGRNRDERRAEQRIGTGREDLQLPRRAVELVGESEVDALAAPDPVRLHQLDALGPAGQRVQRRQEFRRVLRDAQVVHRDLALLDRRARAPALAVDHLLVGQDGLVDWVPVDDAGLLVGDPGLQHAQEEPLVPAVVVRPAGGDLARPVEGEAERLQLALHVGDVVVGPLRRRHAVLHGGVFGRQAERVPAHRLQYVVAAHAHEPRQHVADRVVAHVAHVQSPGRVREHGQAVVLRPRRILGGEKRAGAIPVGLGGGLDGRGVVAFFHGQCSSAPHAAGSRSAESAAKDTGKQARFGCGGRRRPRAEGQAGTTGMRTARPFQAAGPESWTDSPAGVTATVTGMSLTSNS